MKPVTFDIPMPLIKGKGGVQRLLSANLYRNAYFHTLNASKVEYDSVIDNVLSTLKPFTVPVKMEFKFYFTTKRRRDIDNFLFPVSKYLCDSLTKRGILVDDNMKYYPEVSAQYGGQDEDNHVTVTICKSKVSVKELDCNPRAGKLKGEEE
jgi:Holliday junction resolvase RusA-like endonuclease